MSSRESEVFAAFLADGAPPKVIASRLGLAYGTVRMYWTRILHKTRCPDQVGVLLRFIDFLSPASRPPVSDVADESRNLRS